MQRFVKKIVELMREENLFSWQGGPIIMLQIENEYGNIEGAYGQKGKDYVKWAANMAVGLGAGVPWVMCQQVDAPEFILDACNGYYCDSFRPNSKKKPMLWTENWDGWFASWGGAIPHRPVEDLAFAVARFFQRGGSFQNYYMYFGGTNFGRTSGGPNYITSYDYDAPLDEYGLLSQPKWGHLKDLHAAIKLCEPALVAADSPQYMKLGPQQEVHVYRGNITQGLTTAFSTSKSVCAAFLANIDEHKAADIEFLGQVYTLPPWSVSILPDCRHVAFNTAKVGAQTSIKLVDFNLPSSKMNVPQPLTFQDEVTYIANDWMTLKEPIGLWSKNNFTSLSIMEHLNVTKDKSDYLWYTTRLYISEDEISFWEENEVSPELSIDSMRDLVRIFINGKLSGSAKGDWIKVVHPIQLVQGYNDIVLLSETVGLQNYGAFLEKDGAGFKGRIKLTNSKNGDVDLTESSWTYQVGLKGEFQKLYTREKAESVRWMKLTPDATPSIFSWYKTYFDAPVGTDPVVLNLGSMGKGQAWVNGHHIGRYWDLISPKDGCRPCDYRGAYSSEKCTTNCGNPTQIWYHVPRSWLQRDQNLLVMFEETGGNPYKITINTISAQTICGRVPETHYPPLHIWGHPDFINGKISINDMTPELHLQCEDEHTISSIEFASYGTPQGNCQNLSKGNCHAPNSLSVVSQACQGRNSCSIAVSNDVFGDPCRGIVKTLSVQARCLPSSFARSASM
ncbi:beta-galactosidase 9 isoform X2 [Daucus carota subsp. sativus]|nr:PREDICTED: beta-galactosidase 9-like isoform X2 [Daucus carota subsp. sativus]